MNFQQAVAVLAAESQVSDLAPDVDGLVQLEYDSTIMLTAFSPDGSEALYLAASLMELPQPVDARFYERLLKMNFLLLDTRGATLSLDEEGRQVHLCLCVPFESLSDDALSRIISGFLETALSLQSALAAAPTGGDEPLAAGDLSRFDLKRV